MACNRTRISQIMYELKEYLNAINSSKERLMDGEDEMWEKKYPAYIVNKCVAPFQDTIFLVNEMNMNHHMDNKLQFDFLLNSISKRKRFDKWQKAENSEDLEYVKQYFNYSYPKAVQALSILSPKQLNEIKTILNKKGGTK